MKTSQINYSVRPEKIEEHLSLIKQVFHELERNNVKRVTYSCYQTDEFTFMHNCTVC